MVWRIHFTPDDLCRIRIAPDADPMWEILLSLHVVGGQVGGPEIGRWRGRTMREIPKAWGPLLTLAPVWGYSVDFLTPAAGTTELAEGLEQVMGTPRHLLAADLTRLEFGRDIPLWARDLADGKPQVLRALSRMLAGYFGKTIEPYWPQLRTMVADERARLAGSLLSGGVDALLSGVHPTLRWEYPILSVVNKVGERDIRLAGRGISLLPAVFANDETSWLSPSDDAPPTLAYPITHQLRWDDDHRAGEGVCALEQVIGRSRARLLDLVSDQTMTTTELANRLGLTIASASRQAKALREAGLLTSTQHGKAVQHRISRMGRQLIRLPANESNRAEHAEYSVVNP